MHKFVRNLITEWRRLELPVAGETIIVAVSGGADSLSLLLGIHDLTKRKKLGHRIVMAHLNHGIRGKAADADEAFVRDASGRLGIELVSARAKLPKKGNLEQSARDARYDFLRRAAEKENAFAILTGHTMDDQAETLLLNLIRGAGAEGLGGINAVRFLESEKMSKGENESESHLLLIRPLLRWARRSDTEDFCRDLGVAFRSDSMNENTDFRRVRIRKEVIPMLAELNPKIVETLTATAQVMRQEPTGTIDAETLSIEELRRLESPRRVETLRAWLRQRRGNTRSLGLKHIEAVERLALSRRSGRVVELPGKATVTRSGGLLCYRAEKDVADSEKNSS